jgi:hypothetical protein
MNNRLGNVKKVFKYRVKKGSSIIMSQILEFPVDQVDSRMDGKICRITDDYPIGKNIKKEYINDYKLDKLWRIEIYGITDKEFLIVQSLLEELDELVYITT